MNLIVICNPTKKQEISLYRNGTCIEMLSVFANELEDTIMSILEKNDVSQINLCGELSYVKGIKKNLSNKVFCKINIVKKD